MPESQNSKIKKNTETRFIKKIYNVCKTFSASPIKIDFLKDSGRNIYN